MVTSCVLYFYWMAAESMNAQFRRTHRSILQVAMETEYVGTICWTLHHLGHTHTLLNFSVPSHRSDDGCWRNKILWCNFADGEIFELNVLHAVARVPDAAELPVVPRPC